MLPTIKTQVNDYKDYKTAKTATVWGSGLFSDSALYVGCPIPTENVYTCDQALAHIMLFDKVLSTEEMRDLYHGCTLLERGNA